MDDVTPFSKWLLNPRPTAPMALTLTVGVVMACCLTMSWAPVSMAADTKTDSALSGYETALFARSYASESLEQRLERLETTLFGQPQTGDVQARLTQTMSVLSQQFNQLPVQDTTSAGVSTKSPIDGQPIPTQIPSLPQAPANATDGTDYPTVTEMERNLFQKAYTSEDITERLKRLEMHVFKQTFDTLPMVDRVDQLSLKVVPNSPLQVEEQLPLGKGIFSVQPQGQSGRRKKKGETPDPNASLSNKTTTVPSPSDAAIYGHLASLEERLFSQTFGGEILVNRLTRLENTVFGTAKAGDPMERLMAIKTAVSQRPDLNRPSNAPINLNNGRNPVPRQWAGGAIPQSSINPQPYGGRSGYRPPQVPTNQPRPWAIQGDGQVVIPNSGAVPYGSTVVSPYSGVGNSIMQSVSAMEQQVFGRTLEQQQSLVQRVAGLESTLLGRSYPQLNIQQRINQLRQALMANPQPNQSPSGQGLPSTDATADPLSDPLNSGPIVAPDALTQYNTQAYTNPPDAPPQPWWARMLKGRPSKQTPAASPGGLPTQSLPYVPVDTGPVEEPINDTPASHQARW